MSQQSDKKRGQIVSIMDAKCPHCGRPPEAGVAAYANNYIWNGDRWVLLASYEGGIFSANLAMKPGGDK